MTQRTETVRLMRALMALIAAGTLLGAGSARADSTPGLGGYSGSAQADGVHSLYNPAGLLPIAAPLDLGSPDAYVAISTGPSTFARAGVAYPGDLLANPDALLQAGVSGWKAGTIPEYPYKATASSGTGQPSDESNPAPGLDARAKADTSGSSAIATMPALVTPAFLTVGSSTSTATTNVDESAVTIHGHTEISNVDVLGIVRIGSVVTDLTAASDGTTTTLSGGTIVSDASVLGVPVEIDAGGVRAAPGATTTTNPVSDVLGKAIQPLVGSIDEVLAQAGIRLTVAAPVQQGNGKSGQLASAGLRIDLDFSASSYSALESLLDSVPYVENPVPGTPSVSDLVQLARTHHLVTLQLARGQVVLSARPAAPSTPASVATTEGRPGSRPNTSTGPGSASSPARSAAGTTVLAPSITSAAPSRTAAGDQPVAPLTAGVGIVALLMLLAQPLVGDRVGRAGAALLHPGAAARCTLEER